MADAYGERFYHCVEDGLLILMPSTDTIGGKFGHRPIISPVEKIEAERKVEN